MTTANLTSSDEVVALVMGSHFDGRERVLLTFTPSEVLGLGEQDLVDAQISLAEQRRLIDASSALVAAELERRSDRKFGHTGLAQRRGARSGTELVQRLTGLSFTDARTLVRVGTLVTELASPPAAPPAAEGSPDLLELGGVGEPGSPWLAGVASAVRAGELSVAAAEAIRVGLGETAEHISVEQLSDAATLLVREARQLKLEQLAVRARALRDELDESGIALREEERRAKRYLHIFATDDGMTRINGLLDPESAARLKGAIDAVTAPRRGGPRFVDAEQVARDAAIENDPRTTEQLALDALVELVRIGTLADRGRVLGARRVGVRVHVAERDLRRGAGIARIEGQTAPISIASAERIACDSGVTPIVFDMNGEPLDVGRNQRLFTSRQRMALAARDGGCRRPGCDHPPEWTEAHHCDEWLQHAGPTDLANGILLCAYHHKELHNSGAKIERVGNDYYWTPPPSAADRTPIPMPAKALVQLRPTG